MVTPIASFKTTVIWIKVCKSAEDCSLLYQISFIDTYLKD